MKKRICALLVLLALLTSTFAFSFNAEDAAAAPAVDTTTTGAAALTEVGAGGLDFYSVTINYEKEILVDYVYKNKVGFLFVNDDGEYTMSDKYVWRAGTDKNNGYNLNKVKKSADFNFYQMQSSELGIRPLAYYSKVPYKYAYITHIQDGAVIKTKESIGFYGITAPYDDGDPYVNKNPNIEYDADGYAIDKNVDENTNENFRIDINNYRITKDYLWLDSTGARVELFYQKCRYVCTGPDTKGKWKYSQDNIVFVDEWVSFPYEARFDENGKVKNLKSGLYVLQYVTRDELTEFISAEEAKNTASATNPVYYDFHVETDFDKIAEMTSSAGKKNYYFPKAEKTYSYKYRVAMPELPEQTTPTDDPAVTAQREQILKDYYSTSKTFNQDDIAKDKEGNKITSTPVQGDPKLDVKIKSITVEIDAVGSQLYTDETQDPQYQNTITISLNDFELSCLEKQRALDENYITQEKFNEFSSMILGTVHSKTTSTAPDFGKDNVNENYKATVVSLDLGLTEEQLAKIPETATIYLNFHIKTHQPEEAFDVSQTDNTKGETKMTKENADIYRLPDHTLEPTPDPNAKNNDVPWGLIAGIGGGVVGLAVIGVVIGVLASKKKKKA